MLLLSLAVWVAGAWAQDDQAFTAPKYAYRVVATHPHDPQAFTQGLRFHEGHLYEGTGKRGRSRLTKIELETGTVVQTKELPRRYFGEGIEIVGDSVYQLTWQSHLAFVHDLASFATTGSHYIATEGWGLAYDGESLVLSDGTATLQFLDPDTFQRRRVLEVTDDGRPISHLNELEYIDGEIWANVWMTDFIVLIDPADGRLTGYLDLRELTARTAAGNAEAVLNGIAWDAEGRRLFVTGKYWDTLFEIELTDRLSPAAQ